MMSIDNKDIYEHSEHKEQFEDTEVILDTQRKREVGQSLIQLKEELSWLQEQVHDEISKEKSDSSQDHNHRTKDLVNATHTQNSLVKDRISNMNPGSSPESNRGREQAYTNVSDFATKIVSQLPFGLDKFFLDA